eukprot:9819132-Alexandrium_andersonii.AAC.1
MAPARPHRCSRRAHGGRPRGTQLPEWRYGSVPCPWYCPTSLQPSGGAPHPPACRECWRPQSHTGSPRRQGMVTWPPPQTGGTEKSHGKPPE